MTNTTIADHGRRRHKWPPSAPHEALRSALKRRMDRGQPPKQADIILGLLRVCHSNVVAIHHCWNKGTLWGPYTPSITQKLYPLARGVVSHPFDASAWSARPHVGRWGAISAGGSHGCGGCDASCVCAKVLKNAIKTLKLVVCKQTFFFTINCKTYYNSHNASCSWPEPKPLWSNGTPAYWVSPVSW